VYSFARELRFRCARKGSIAQLCKATGINRQQFNKYLAGQILPNARTMRKICVYLGVSEAQLMAGYTPARASELSSTQLEIDFLPGPTSGANHAVLPNGYYASYFPVYGHPNLVACWLVHIRSQSDGGQAHTCRLHIHGGRAMGYSADHLRYSGYVRYGAHDACLVSTSVAGLPLQGIVLVSLRRMTDQNFFPTMTLTSRTDGLLALSGAMRFLGAGCTARDALSGMGVVRLDDPAIDPVIVRILSPPPSAWAGPNRIQSASVRNLRRGELAGGSMLPEALSMRRLSV
jgi:transcriptional regulator with XRE-family HTH domain